MKGKRFKEEQIIRILHEAERGMTEILPEHWTSGMLGFPPTEENQHEEEQIYR